MLNKKSLTPIFAALILALFLLWQNSLSSPAPKPTQIENLPSFTTSASSAADSGNPAEDAGRKANREFEKPAYCDPKQDVMAHSGSPSREFLSRHPELGMTLADVALVFGSIAEIGIIAATPTYEVDLRSNTVFREGTYHQQAIEQVAQMVGADPEAALIYGSHLMRLGWLGHDGNPDLAGLQAGEQLLQVAARNGQHDAIYRIYWYYSGASTNAWRRSGRSAEWHSLETMRAAYSLWLMRYGTPGQALMADNDHRNSYTNGPDGQLMPSGETHNPTAAMNKLSLLERALPTPNLSQEQIRAREQLLWLNRRKLIEQMIEEWMTDCGEAAVRAASTSG